MSNTLPLFAIDDNVLNLKNAAQGLRALTQREEGSSIELHDLHIGGNAQYIEVRDKLATLSGRGIILLDLNFKSAWLWPEIEDAIRALSARTGLDFRMSTDGPSVSLRTEEGDRYIMGPPLDGLSLIETIFQNKMLAPCLVIICSAAGELGDLKSFLDLFNSIARKMNRDVIFMRELDGRNLGSSANAIGIFRDLEKYWSTEFPDFSPVPLTNATILEWLSYFRSVVREDKGGLGLNFCLHDHIQRNAVMYAEILHKGLSCEIGMAALKDRNSLKAIFMHDQSHSADRWPNAAFTQWRADADCFRDTAKPISQEIFTSLLHSMSGLEAVVPSSGVKLPLTPGLPFLLSLNNLFHSLREEEILIKSGAVVVTSGDSGTRLTIPLRQLVGMEFGLARTWTKKMAQGRGALNSGICGSIYNALIAKVQISGRAITDNSEKLLLRIFEGQNKPVAGVLFAPHFIHLHWN